MRQPKPFFRKFTKSWYVTIRGKQYPLGKNKKLAWQRYHEIMASQAATDQLATVAQLCDIYLDWCKRHRKEGTFDKHKRYLQSFVGLIGTRLPIAKLRKKHITAWVDSLDLGSTTQNDAISIVVRVFNWALEEGHIEKSPLPRIKKPPRKRREVYYTQEQWQQIQSHVRDREFFDLLDFLWLTGSRPHEARILEASHVDLNEKICVLPASLAKGGIHERVIFLCEQATAIIERLVHKHSTGPLFRNTRGNPWTRDAIKCRLTRISKKVGFGPPSCSVIFFSTRTTLRGRQAPWLARRIREGLIYSDVIDVHRPAKVGCPLHVHYHGNDRPNVHRIVDIAEKRRSQPAEPTRVYWPTSRYAELFGTWTGQDELHNAHKASHDLMVTASWIYYWDRCQATATRDWVSERELEYEIRRGRSPFSLTRRIPRPDAIICGQEQMTAVEIVGYYPWAWLNAKIARFEAACWDYTIF